MDKLDLMTRLYLYFKHVNILNHDDYDVEVNKINKEDMYLFNSYDEYVKYYLEYLDKVDENLIKQAIYTVGSKGEIIAYKGLCEYIIVKQITDDFYKSYDEEKIKDIHSRGKLTPTEKLMEVERKYQCFPSDGKGYVGERCSFFMNCHECLREYFSHKNEYDKSETQQKVYAKRASM